MKRKILLVLCAATVWMTAPLESFAAGSLDTINKRINQIKQEQKAAEKKINQIDNRMQSIESEKKNVTTDLMSIDLKLNETQDRIQQLDKQIDDTTLQVQEAGVQLDEVTKRVEKRDELLKTRVKVMHEMGDISYLEVLLGAKSFGDFLNRLDAVQLVVNQDAKILEENKKDRDSIEQKKLEIETHLEQLSAFFNETSKLNNQLSQQRKERTVMMAKLVEQEGAFEKIKEEQEQAMLDLMEKMKKALSEKNKILSTAKYSGGKFAWPVPSSTRITSYFGLRKDPFTGKSSGHNGLDIGAPQGTAIVAAADGVVIYSTYVRGYGNAISIGHGGNVSTLYAHIREGGLFVKEGQTVKKGQKIAEVGSTGRSTGPHLHFGVYKGRTAADPLAYLKK
jgi:murein DD-endopeptidase MepM/ murein hydrolase activator NlpD